MTLQATTRRSPTYTGTGVSVTYSFAFKVFSAADVAVYVADTTGVETLLTGGYTVSLNADQENNQGGGVTLATPLPSGFKLTIVGAVALSQPADLPDGGSYRAQTVEDALDRTVMQLQQVDEKIGRAILLPVNVGQTPPQLPVPVPNSFIGWNATADKLVNLDAADLVTSVAYGSVSVTPFVGTGVVGQTVVLSTNPGSINNIQPFIAGGAQEPEVDFVWDANRTITFTNAVGLGVEGFVRYNQALPIGEVPAASVGTGNIVDEAVTLDKLAPDVTSSLGASKLQPLSAVVNTTGFFGSLTITLGPTSLDFRRLPINIGGADTVNIPAPISITIPAAATLGVPAEPFQPFTLVVLALKTPSGVVLGVANLSGAGAQITEAAGVNSTAISTGSTSDTTVYSTAPQVDVPYRVVGLVRGRREPGEGWDVLTLQVHGAGSQLVGSLSSFGVSQQYRSQLLERVLGVTYYNNLPIPIFVHVAATFNVVGGYLLAVVKGEIAGTSPAAYATSVRTSVSFVVPPHTGYSVTSTVTPWTVVNWAEMR